MAARIRRGDTVEVITGKYKGIRGEVLRVFPRAERALVAGVNIATKHTKPRGMGQPGGIVREEASIHLSNVMLVDPKSEKRTRVGGCPVSVTATPRPAATLSARGTLISSVRRFGA